MPASNNLLAVFGPNSFLIEISSSIAFFFYSFINNKKISLLQKHEAVNESINIKNRYLIYFFNRYDTNE